MGVLLLAPYWKICTGEKHVTQSSAPSLSVHKVSYQRPPAEDSVDILIGGLGGGRGEEASLAPNEVYNEKTQAEEGDVGGLKELEERKS
ncbi:hypothetical protein INR49_000476 [Caranx melampygus]|nr:hypothetical protein INR49_000476 [Caranx melampygus]